MINHARTLLMNVDGEHFEQPDIPGDAYIPEYTPLELSAALEQIRTALFGLDPDYEGIVYRASQYLGIMNSTEYGSYVPALDSRVTYDPDDLQVVDSGLYGPVVVGDGLVVTGTWADGGMTGRVNTKWRITALDSDNLLVENMTDGLAEQYRLAEPKVLIGSTLSFSIAEQPLTEGETWRVYYKSRVTPDLGQVLANLKNTSADVLSAVFGPRPRVEPFKTFSNLFNKHYALPYQISGLVLAYVYTLEAQRTDA